MHNINIVHFHNGSGGGVLTVLNNLLAYRQHDQIINKLVYVIKEPSEHYYKASIIHNGYNEQTCFYSGSWNFYATSQRLSKTLPDRDSVIVAHDWLELGMVSHLGLQNPVVMVLHGNYDYYYNLAVKHEQNIDVFICIAGSIQERLTERLPHRKEDIYYRRFPVREPVKKRVAGRVEKIVFIGRCERAKGYHLLPEIDRALIQLNCVVHWAVIGAGSLLPENQLTWSKNSKVSFLGELSNEEVLDILPAFDAIVLPSFAEGMPVAVIEAMKAGVIPIVNDLPGGLQELVENGVTGYRIAANDPAVFAARINELTHNEVLTQQLSGACIKLAREMFNAEKNTSAFEDLFIKAAQNKREKIKKRVYGSTLDRWWLPNLLVNAIRKSVRRNKKDNV